MKTTGQFKGNEAAGLSGKDSGSGEWQAFGRRVEQLRLAAGLSHEDLAMREALSADELRRVESGTTVPFRSTANYLDGRTGARGRLVNAWARATINAHLASGAPPHGLDSGAGTVREFHPGLIPASLQTHDYSTALGRNHGRGRKSGWNRSDGLRVVVNENALRTAIGGREVMREQLRRLRGSVRDSGLRFQIIPREAREHPCPMGPFRLLTLGPSYTVAHVMAPCGDGQLITEPGDVQAFIDLFEDLRGAALPTAESLDLLTDIAAAFESTPDRKAITAGRNGSETSTPLGGVAAQHAAR
ncbi:helix-turn-helix transcriptional regulator [Nocardiopsis dassonvillei]